MKTRKLLAVLLFPVLAGPLTLLQAQISEADALVLIVQLQAAETPTADIVSRLLLEGLTLDEILALLAPHTNQSEVGPLMIALVEFGIPAEDVAAMVVAMHSVATTGAKLAELEQSGMTREMGSRLLVALALSDDPLERMRALTGDLGMATQEAAQLLIFLTTQPSPPEIMRGMAAIGLDSATAATLLVANNVAMDPDAILEAMLDQGLSLAQATDIIIATESTATFAQPLAEIVSQTFTPSNFSNDALTGAAGGGVSTSQ